LTGMSGNVREFYFGDLVGTLLPLLLVDNYTHVFVHVCRYSDFVVHEIDKDGNVVRLTDINPPTNVEFQSNATEEVSRLTTMCYSGKNSFSVHRSI